MGISRGGSITVTTTAQMVTLPLKAKRLTIINDDATSLFVRKNPEEDDYESVSVDDDIEVKSGEGFNFGLEMFPIKSFAVITATGSTTARWAIEL